MVFNNRITRSLCAVLLCVSLLLSQDVLASEGDTNSQAESTSYVYAIDIDFGNLAFYYDYGVWNVNTMRYEASSTSTNPAVGTEPGFPGWYGFDGTSNQIKITNRSSGGYAVTFDLSYRSLTEAEWAEAGVAQSVSNVALTVTDNAGAPLQSMTLPANENVPVYWYIHLSGQPMVTGTPYHSDTMNPIGMLTIKIVNWDGKDT